MMIIQVTSYFDYITFQNACEYIFHILINAFSNILIFSYDAKNIKELYSILFCLHRTINSLKSTRKVTKH